MFIIIQNSGIDNNRYRQLEFKKSERVSKLNWILKLTDYSII